MTRGNGTALIGRNWKRPGRVDAPPAEWPMIASVIVLSFLEVTWSAVACFRTLWIPGNGMETYGLREPRLGRARAGDRRWFSVENRLCYWAGRERMGSPSEAPGSGMGSTGPNGK